MKATPLKRRAAWLDLQPAFSAELHPNAPPLPSFHSSLEAISKRDTVDAEPHKPLTLQEDMKQRSQKNLRRLPLAEQIVVWLRNQLRGMAKQRSKTREPNRPPLQVARPSASERAPASNGLVGAWSWLRTKYQSSATKRLHVTEVASLGEKRFVALINVGNREFLIGGGTSGVTLLTPLKSLKNEPEWLAADLCDAGDL